MPMAPRPNSVRISYLPKRSFLRSSMLMSVILHVPETWGHRFSYIGNCARLGHTSTDIVTRRAKGSKLRTLPTCSIPREPQKTGNGTKMAQTGPYQIRLHNSREPPGFSMLSGSSESTFFPCECGFVAECFAHAQGAHLSMCPSCRLFR